MLCLDLQLVVDSLETISKFLLVSSFVRRAFKECDSSVLRGRTSSNEEGKFGRERESHILAACARAADLEGWALSSLFPGQLLS